jgi:hypothetical protein
MPRYVIHITGMVDSRPSRYDDSYVKRYDFDTDEPDTCNLDTVRSPEYALQFASAEAAWEIWRQVDPRTPVRADGRPNRPLTVFNVGIEQVPDSNIDGSHRETQS